MSGRSHPYLLCGAGAIPSISALRCPGDPIPLRSALPGRSHSSPLYGIGTIPPLSAMRCRGETILLRFTVLGWDYPSPLYGIGTIPSLSIRAPICGVGAIPSLSALRCRVDPIPLCSVVPGRSHPSPLCVAGAIPFLFALSWQRNRWRVQKICGFCAKSYKRTAKERQGIYQLLISIICNDMIMKWIKCSFIHQTNVWPFNLHKGESVSSGWVPATAWEHNYVYIVKPDIHTT